MIEPSHTLTPLGYHVITMMVIFKEGLGAALAAFDRARRRILAGGTIAVCDADADQNKAVESFRGIPFDLKKVFPLKITICS